MALVVLHHFFPEWVLGGYVGVDVFFVVSGYLVLGSLLKKLVASETVSWKDFYYKRAKRILPAAVVVALATLYAYVLYLNPLQADRYARDALLSVGFLANFRMRAEPGGYFAVADPSPFRHYWTLAVEEQFYLLLPLAALVLGPVVARWGRRGLLWTMGIGTVGFFVGSAFVALLHPTLAFFMLPTRTWEFLVGGLIALLPQLRSSSLTPLGLAGIGLSVLMLAPGSWVPGPWLLPAVLGTALIIVSDDRDVISRALSVRPMRWLGDRSYALYLTHWPVAAWLFLSANGQPATLTERIVGIVLALGAAQVLYAGVESPLHHGSLARKGPRVVLPATGLLTTAALVASLAMPSWVRLDSGQRIDALTASEVLAGPLPTAEAVPVNLKPSLKGSRELNALYNGCHEQLGSTQPTPCVFGGSWRETDVVVLGDSHAAHWFDAVQAAVDEGTTTAFLTHTSCPLFDAGALQPDSCALWRDRALRKVRDLDPDVVLLSNYTAGYDEGSRPAAIEQGWEAALDVLDPSKVVVLGDVPTPSHDVVRCLARHVEDAKRCTFSINAEQRRLDLVERGAVEDAGARWIDTKPWFCGASCSVIAGNNLLWRDTAGHLTPNGSALLAPRVRGALMGIA